MLKRPDTIKHQRFADQEVEDALAGAFEAALKDNTFYRNLSNHLAAIRLIEQHPEEVSKFVNAWGKENGRSYTDGELTQIKETLISEYESMLSEAAQVLHGQLQPILKPIENKMTHVGMIKRALGRYVGHGTHVWDDQLDSLMKNEINLAAGRFPTIDVDTFYSPLFWTGLSDNKPGDFKNSIQGLVAGNLDIKKVEGIVRDDQRAMLGKLKDQYKDLHGDAINDLIEHVAKGIEQEVDTAQNYVQSMQSRFGKHGIDPRTGDVLSPGNKLFYGVTGVMLGGGMMFHGGEMVHLGLRGGKKGDGTETEPSIIRTVIGAGEIVGGAALAIKLLAGKIMGR